MGEAGALQSFREGRERMGQQALRHTIDALVDAGRELERLARAKIFAHQSESEKQALKA